MAMKAHPYNSKRAIAVRVITEPTASSTAVGAALLAAAQKAAA